MLHLLRLQTASGFNNCQWCSQQWNFLQALLWQKFRAQRIRIWRIKCTFTLGRWTRTICRWPGAVSRNKALLVYTDAYFSMFILRVDFMPSPRGGGNPNDLKCCPRCGCNVYEAEKLIAAGRVKTSKDQLAPCTLFETYWKKSHFTIVSTGSIIAILALFLVLKFKYRRLPI